MRLALLLGSLLLLAATQASMPGHAGPFAGAPPCDPGATGRCPAGGEPARVQRVDWFDDLFGIELPPGSWRDSCRKARVDGHFLNAECRRKSGSYRAVTFDLRGCSGDIGNDNGKLVCERQRRGEGSSEEKLQTVSPGKE